MKKSFAVIAFLLMLCVPCSADNLTAECSNGKFVGVLSSDNVITWLGVPYAQPPVGSLRWKAPVSPDASTETFNADKISAMPIQTVSAMTYASMMPQDEDCLYLNVWKKSDDTAPASRPVMVWVHGGSFRCNGTGEPEWTGRNLAGDDSGIIVVSVGYRLGLMGFIDFSEVSGGSEFSQSGNLGILDVLQSLKWLHENISAFGGNPDNITLFGQSSGSALISLLMTIPEANGLFKRAILQSGAVSMSMSSADATGLAQELLKVTGTKDMVGLMALSSNDLQKATSKLESKLNFPERDGVVLSEDVYAAFEANARDYDILIGSNANEANYFIAASSMSLDVFANYVTNAYTRIKAAVSQIPDYGEGMLALMDKFIELQGDVEPFWAYTEFINELLFRLPAIKMASSRTGTGKTYMYYWNIPSIIPSFGACHASEIPYVLDTPGLLVPLVAQGIRQKVQGMWTDFAKDGELASNTQYTSTDRTTIIFSPDVTLTAALTKEEKDPLSQNRQLIEPLLVLGVSGREIINAMAASGSETESESETNSETDNSVSNNARGSSSGCNAGMFSLVPALLVMSAVIISRK